MQIVHMWEPNLCLLLNDDLDILGIQRVSRNYQPKPFVKALRAIHTKAWGPPTITSSGYYEADGLGCFQLFIWIAEQYPRLSVKAVGKRFDQLFADNPKDALVAVGRIFDGTWKNAPGEQAAFCTSQWTRHPQEMDEIAMLGAALRTMQNA